MNNSQLRRLGVPENCLREATTGIRDAVEQKVLKGQAVKRRLAEILSNPEPFINDKNFASFARALIEDRDQPVHDPISYRTWGTEIDEQSHHQMQQACRLPAARQAALMPDAHVGYGLPIGGVLGLENAIVPYAVGVDIACRMKLSVVDLPVESMSQKFHQFRDAIERGTVFGVGARNPARPWHEVLDQDWTVSRVTRENRDKAVAQLGTSGSGNHFVEFGELILESPELGLEAGRYPALLSHSGSRGPGAAVCNTYSSIAQRKLPRKYQEFGRLAWLDMDSQEGQEYWLAMQLMGEFAAANHAVIHRRVMELLGAQAIAGVENHHNFAWKELHQGRELIVHRKGATPAAEGVLGVIPGSMATPAYVVRGRGNPESLDSASHGAGRRMSRKQARSSYNFRATQARLEELGIHVLAAGADEVPDVYKNIDDVMREQQDLVRIVARFEPRIVRMCDDGSRAED